jgi:hypothetical protein
MRKRKFGLYLFKMPYNNEYDFKIYLKNSMKEYDVGHLMLITNFNNNPVKPAKPVVSRQKYIELMTNIYERYK